MCTGFVLFCPTNARNIYSCSLKGGDKAAHFLSVSPPQRKLHLCISMHGWSAI